MKNTFAVIQLGGTQHIVSEGDEVTVNRLSGKVGDKVSIDEVLMFTKDDKTEVGTPFVKYSVDSVITEQFKGKKIDVRKYKAKARYRKHIGHRQHLTKLRIEKISSKKK